MKKTLILLTAVILYSCDHPGIEHDDKDNRLNNYHTTDKLYENGFLTIDIVTVRNCEYVLWHNSYGSDMEHYEDCKNPYH